MTGPWESRGPRRTAETRPEPHEGHDALLQRSPPAWTSGPCRALDHHFVLQIEPEHGFREHLAPVVEPFRVGWTPGDCTTVYRVVAVDGGDAVLMNGERQIAAGRDGEAMLPWLVWNLNRDVIEHSSERHVLVHAAGATRGGVTVILPADQECGKTTTVAGLLREGFGYVTDEAVAINPGDLTINPFPKTLSLDAGSWHLFPDCRPLFASEYCTQWQVSPQAMGARPARGPVDPPGIIVFPQFVAGAPTSLVPVFAGYAVREMARMTFRFSDAPARNLAVLARVASRARTARLTIGSLERAVEEIENLVSDVMMEWL